MNTLFKTTTAVLNNSARAVALSKSQNKNLESIVKSLRGKFVQIKSEMTLQEVKDLYSVLINLESKVDLRKCLAENKTPSETILWYLHGGNAGLAWSRSVLKSEGILKSYSKDITEEEMQQEGESVWNKAPVVKSLNEELKQVTYVAMQEGVDLHGDLVTAQEVQKAHASFSKSAMKANLFHMMMTDTFSVLESYLAPVDMVLSEHFVKKGTWLMTLQVNDDDVWQLIKSGEINGISIGALANVEDIEDDTDN